MAKSEEKALAIYEPGLLQVSEEMSEALAVALDDDEELGLGDLPQVTPPGGGAGFYTMPDGQPAKEFDAVVFLHQRVRSYWVEDYEETGGGSPPDCLSLDNKIGHGMYGEGSEDNPSGQCASCPMSAFGNDEDPNAAPPCSQRVRLFMVLPGMALPTVLSVPPSGLGGQRAWRNRSLGAGRAYFTWPTRFASEEATQRGGGLKYHRVTMEFLPDALTDEVIGEVREYRDKWAPRLRQSEVGLR